MACTVAALLSKETTRLAAWLTLQPYPPSDPVSVARFEIEQLLCKATGWSRTRLLLELSAPICDAAASTVRVWVDARLRGEPLQYLLGEASFRGRLFVVRSGCLIPRPETELLVDCAIDWVQNHLPTALVLDLGTGSGCIAISVALECPVARVLTIDVSPVALSIAVDNAVNHGLDVLRCGSEGLAGSNAAPETRATSSTGPKQSLALIAGDGLDWLRQAAFSGAPESSRSGCHRDIVDTQEAPKLNLLISNPPYIPTAEVAELASEVRDYEPGVALDGGPDGMRFYRQISEVGPAFYAPGPAAFFFEVGAGQSDDVMGLFRMSGLWAGWAFGVERDLRGIDRVVWGRRESSK